MDPSCALVDALLLNSEKVVPEDGVFWKIFFAFTPVCCLLFLAEITFFAILGGKEEDLRKTTNAFLARFQLHFWGAFFTIKLGKNENICQNVGGKSV